MKQLIQTLDEDQPHVIVGLHTCALAIAGNTQCCELTKPLPPPVVALGQAKDDNTKQLPENDLSDIQAVALTRRAATNEIWYAVARQDKSLAVYCTPATNSTRPSDDDDDRKAPHQKMLHPVTIHKTAKRVSCLCFAHLDDTLTVVIAGDLAGDVVAYPLTNSPEVGPSKETATDDEGESGHSSRLLLGHTASMLTGLYVTHNKIFSSDRDEKIRVSAFPDTHIIYRYLLGHEAFVSCFDVRNNQQCVSGSGDGTIRLWDFGKAQEVARFDTQEAGTDDSSDHNNSLLPTKVLFTRTGDSLVVIYDDALYIDLFCIARNSESQTVTLSRSCRVECEAQPLAIALLGQDGILVVTGEPTFVQVFQITSVANQPTLEPAAVEWTTRLRSYALSSGIEMPGSILERDKWGNLKMSKVTESRGPAHRMPWNNGSRKETARESNRRAAKRRRGRQTGTTT